MKYEELSKNFGFKLKVLRMKKNMTQSVLAEILGWQENYLSEVERGKVNVTLKTINKIANALDIDEIRLFDFKD